MQVDHEAAVWGGKVECNSPHAPRSMRSARLGRRPARASGWMNWKVAPSRPMIITRGGICDSNLQVAQIAQAFAHAFFFVRREVRGAVRRAYAGGLALALFARA